MPKYQNPQFGSIGKLKEACHSMHLAEMPRMKRISKPRLPIKIYSFQEIMSTEEFQEEGDGGRLKKNCQFGNSGIQGDFSIKRKRS
jgi:hypothetical protein